MACVDIQVRQLPLDRDTHEYRGGRILVWLVTPRRPPLVLDPYPEEGNGASAGWWAIARLDDRYYYVGRAPLAKQ